MKKALLLLSFALLVGMLHAPVVSPAGSFQLPDEKVFDFAPVGNCDWACGMKPIPPIGCTQHAICACENLHSCQGCNWVFTDCH